MVFFAPNFLLTFTRHGAAHYELYPQGSKNLVAAGTLVVSDELADTWCLPEGNYRLKLNDKNLYELRHKHAAIRVSDRRLDDDANPAPCISGTGSIFFSLGEPSISWATSVNWYLQIGFYSLVAVIVAIAVGVYIRYKGVSDSNENRQRDAGERSPLIPPSTSRGVGSVELSRA